MIPLGVKGDELGPKGYEKNFLEGCLCAIK